MGNTPSIEPKPPLQKPTQSKPDSPRKVKKETPPATQIESSRPVKSTGAPHSSAPVRSLAYTIRNFPNTSPGALQTGPSDNPHGNYKERTAAAAADLDGRRPASTASVLVDFVPGRDKRARLPEAIEKLIVPCTLLQQALKKCSVENINCQSMADFMEQWPHRHKITKFFWTQHKDVQSHVFAELEEEDPNSKTIILALRESFDLGDWQKNLTFAAELMHMEGKVHKGFYDRSKTIPLATLTNILNQGKKLVLTGFSQGSAVAEVLFARLIRSPNFDSSWMKSVLFMGFGCPPIGDNDFCQSVERHLTGGMSDMMWHFANMRDVIPRTFGLAGHLSGFAEKVLENLLSKTPEAVPIAKEVLGIAFPLYRPVGMWVLMHGGKDFTILDTRQEGDLTKLKETLSFKATSTEKSITVTDIQQHHPASYFNTCQTAFPDAFPIHRKKAPPKETLFLREQENPIMAFPCWISPLCVEVIIKGSVVPLLHFEIPGGESKGLTNDLTTSQLFIVQVPENQVITWTCTTKYGQHLLDPSIESGKLKLEPFIRLQDGPILSLIRAAYFHSLLIPNMRDKELRGLESVFQSRLTDLVKLNTEKEGHATRVKATMSLENGNFGTDEPDLFSTADRIFRGATDWILAQDKDKLDDEVQNAGIEQNEEIQALIAKYPDTLTETYQGVYPEYPLLLPYSYFLDQIRNWDTTKRGEYRVVSFYLAAFPMDLYMFMLLTETLRFNEAIPIVYTGWEQFKRTMFGWIFQSWWPNSVLSLCDRRYIQRVLCAGRFLKLNLDENSSSISDMEAKLLNHPTIKAYIKDFKESSFDSNGITWPIVTPPYGDEDKKSFRSFIKAVKHIHDLRNHLKSTYFVGLLGPQNNGKTSALAHVFQIDDSKNSPSDDPTKSPKGYPLGPENSGKHKANHERSFYVVDFPASNDKNVDNHLVQENVLPFLIVCALFLAAQQADTDESVSLINNAAKNSCGVRLIFITHMDDVNTPLNLGGPKKKNLFMDLEKKPDDKKEEQYPAVAERRFHYLCNSISKYCRHRSFGMYPVCLKFEGVRKLKEMEILSKFDHTKSGEGYTTSFFDDLDEGKFVVYGPRGVRRIIWEYTKTMFGPPLNDEWRNILTDDFGVKH